jgi:hypothetical protein
MGVEQHSAPSTDQLRAQFTSTSFVAVSRGFMIYELWIRLIEISDDLIQPIDFAIDLSHFCKQTTTILTLIWWLSTAVVEILAILTSNQVIEIRILILISRK